MTKARTKILTVVGARPQFIKAAAVSTILRARGTEILVHTGQHYDANMSDIFFDELRAPKPDYALGIGSGMHGNQTARMLSALEDVMVKEKPDWVLIYGDTNSTLAGALAAAKLHIPVAHIEAGLRSFDRRMPEEVNRVVADHLADLLFTPTELAVRQLADEGIRKGVHMVGDVMYDIAKLVSGSWTGGKRPILPFARGEYILATIHRAQNTDDEARLCAIFDGLSEIGKTYQVVVPLHPRTRKVLEASGLLSQLQTQVNIIEPVGYIEMLALEMGAKLIVTDSGGVQKEAYFQRVPCVTLREETEWAELVESGWNRLCKPDSAAVIARTCLSAIGSKGRDVELYGNGHAASQIIDILFAA